MILQYPFSIKLKITVNDPLGDGFTLKEVLYAIKLSYQDIYETEERTSSNHMYILIRECTKCNIINVKRRIKENQSSNGLTDLILNPDNHDSHECSICKDYLVDNSSALSTTDGGGIIKLGGCGHIFHENCIDQWVESNGKTCPLCRASLYNCDSCDGSGYKTIYHEGVVPPIEYRGIEPRQHTDGLYGIHDYYLEDLYVAGLKYNNDDRELFVSVQSLFFFNRSL